MTCVSQPTSSTLVQRTEFPDTNNCHVTSRHDQPTSRSFPTKNGHGFNSAPLPCLPCICCVLCATLVHTRTRQWAVQHTMRQCATMTENKCCAKCGMWMVCGSMKKKKKKKEEKRRKRLTKQKSVQNTNESPMREWPLMCSQAVHKNRDEAWAAIAASQRLHRRLIFYSP